MGSDEEQEGVIRIGAMDRYPDIGCLDELVKRRIGSMCYVSSVPESMDGPIGIGIIRNEISVDDSGKVLSRFECYDDVFTVRLICDRDGHGMVAPSTEDIEAMFCEKIRDMGFSPK